MLSVKPIIYILSVNHTFNENSIETVFLCNSRLVLKALHNILSGGQIDNPDYNLTSFFTKDREVNVFEDLMLSNAICKRFHNVSY